MKEKWTAASPKLEAVLVHNGGEYFVGKAMTYPDILISHMLTWFVEEVSVCRAVLDCTTIAITVHCW